MQSVTFAVRVSCRKPWAPHGGIVLTQSEKCRHCGGSLSPADRRNRHTGSSLPWHKRCCNNRIALEQPQLLPESPAQEKGVPHQSSTAMALTGAHVSFDGLRSLGIQKKLYNYPLYLKAMGPTDGGRILGARPLARNSGNPRQLVGPKGN